MALICDLLRSPTATAGHRRPWRLARSERRSRASTASWSSDREARLGRGSSTRLMSCSRAQGGRGSAHVAARARTSLPGWVGRRARACTTAAPASGFSLLLRGDHRHSAARGAGRSHCSQHCLRVATSAKLSCELPVLRNSRAQLGGATRGRNSSQLSCATPPPLPRRKLRASCATVARELRASCETHTSF